MAGLAWAGATRTSFNFAKATTQSIANIQAPSKPDPERSNAGWRIRNIHHLARPATRGESGSPVAGPPRVGNPAVQLCASPLLHLPQPELVQAVLSGRFHRPFLRVADYSGLIYRIPSRFDDTNSSVKHAARNKLSMGNCQRVEAECGQERRSKCNA